MRFRIYVFLLTAVVFMMGCSRGDKSNLPGLKDVIHLAGIEKGFNVEMENWGDEFNKTLAEINSNLSSVNHLREYIIKQNKSELSPEKDMKQVILYKIQLINSLMAENDRKIEEMQLRILKGDAENEKLQRIIRQMDRKLKKEHEEITELKGELIRKDFEVVSLTEQLEKAELEKENLNNNLNQLKKKMNVGYVAVGSHKELKEKGVIEEKGGLLSFGRVATLNENCSSENFNKIDIKNNLEIPVSGNDIRIITNHPSESYRLKDTNNKITHLQIIDPEEFWKTSRFLVVETR